jgi:lipase chaperone LimK
MEPTDLTIEILMGIREETHRTNEQLAEVRTELGELRNRQTATEVRLATELVGVAGAVREVRDLLREDRALRGKVEDHERRIAAIEARTG